MKFPRVKPVVLAPSLAAVVICAMLAWQPWNSTSDPEAETLSAPIQPQPTIPEHAPSGESLFPDLALQSDPESQTRRAELHLQQGQTEEARVLLVQAAEQAYAPAWHMLGQSWLYEDPEEAFRLTRLTAHSNHAPSQVSVAHLYAQGTGIPADRISSLLWFEIARSNRHPFSPQDFARIADLERNLSAEQIQKVRFNASLLGEHLADFTNRNALRTLETPERQPRTSELARNIPLPRPAHLGSIQVGLNQ